MMVVLSVIVVGAVAALAAAVAGSVYCDAPPDAPPAAPPAAHACGGDVSAFLTGSRAYGTPRPDSDVDVVLRCDARTAAQLYGFAEAGRADEDGIEEARRYGDTNSYSVRFGSLNLIIPSTEAEFQAWRRATAALIGRAPVARDEAVQEIEAELRKIGKR